MDDLIQFDERAWASLPVNLAGARWGLLLLEGAWFVSPAAHGWFNGSCWPNSRRRSGGALSWKEYVIPLDRGDPRNRDRIDPGGERIRVRLNGANLADFVVQYETPLPEAGQTHAVVLRSDGTHGPHYDRYDLHGRKRPVDLPPHLTPKEVVNKAIDDIKNGWQGMRRDFFEGLK